MKWQVTQNKLNCAVMLCLIVYLPIGCGDVIVGGRTAHLQNDIPAFSVDMTIGRSFDRTTYAETDTRGTLADQSVRNDLCPTLSCNWCGGIEQKDSQGCVIGFVCANGVNPCQTAPCSPETPGSCKDGQHCLQDNLCWPCQSTVEICNGLDDDCDNLVDEDEDNLCPNGLTCVLGVCINN